MARVLVVDDDPTVREVVVTYLRAHDHEVVEAGDGETALRLDARGAAGPRRARPDAARASTASRCAGGCARTSDVPVIMLTALGEETDRVMGLEVGADDYVTKPFSPRELALRVDSVLRRTGTSRVSRSRLVDGDLVVDEAAHAAYRDGEPLALTGREFDLLRFLVAHPGRRTRATTCWSRCGAGRSATTSTVTVHVRRLREKIERDPTRPERLQTVWGVGYRWEAAT